MEKPYSGRTEVCKRAYVPTTVAGSLRAIIVLLSLASVSQLRAAELPAEHEEPALKMEPAHRIEPTGRIAEDAGGKWCSYGTQPGRWELYDDVGPALQSRFTPYDPECNPKDLVLEHVRIANASAAGRLSDADAPAKPLILMSFGDSVDAHLTYAYRDATGAAVSYFGPAQKDSIHKCFVLRTPSLTIVHEHLPGVHMVGPFFHPNYTTPPLVRIKEAFLQFHEDFGAEAQPDIVVFSSNFWDISRIHNRGVYLSHDLDDVMLPPAFLSTWLSNATTLMNAIKEEVAGESTLFLFHTMHDPFFFGGSEADKYWEAHPHVYNHISQLNAAGRWLASQLHFELVDFEPMFGQLGHNQILADYTHPKPHHMLMVLNLYLNMHEQFAAKRLHRRLKSDGPPGGPRRSLPLRHRQQKGTTRL